MMMRSPISLVVGACLVACAGTSPNGESPRSTSAASGATVTIAEVPSTEPDETADAEPEPAEPKEPAVADDEGHHGPDDDAARERELAVALADLDIATIGALGQAPPGLPSAGPSGPQGSVAVGGTSTAGGTVSNASAVVARMRSRFRRCYNTSLKTDPKLHGSVTLVADIDAKGNVTRVVGTSKQLGPILGCLKAVVASSAFAPPTGGAATVSIPITFINTK